jgi:hypothetical protein
MADTILPFNVTAGMAYTSDTPIGITGSLPVFTYPDSNTSYDSAKGTLYYEPKYLTGTSSKTAKANRTYFTVVQFPRNTNIKTLQITSLNTVTTGNMYFSVWSIDYTTGYPSQKLYGSASVAVGSGYATTSVTNAAGLVSVAAGTYMFAMTFSSTPTLYFGLNAGESPYGVANRAGGYKMNYVVADTAGYTLPTSITAAGVTFAGVDYDGTFIPFIMYAPVI